MTFKTFIIGLLASFGVPWLAVVAIPYGTMRNIESVSYDQDFDGREGIYAPAREGAIAQGSKIYGQEGCYYCHSQLVRPTFAGNDLWHDGIAGHRPPSTQSPDYRRATNQFDYEGEDIAHIGNRIGPDLSNLVLRLEEKAADRNISVEKWLYLHLYNPRNRGDIDRLTDRIICPSKHNLFDEVSSMQGQAEALPLDTPDGVSVVPNSRGKALVSYLLSLKKDNKENPIPAALSHGFSTTPPSEK